MVWSDCTSSISATLDIVVVACLLVAFNDDYGNDYNHVDNDDDDDDDE